MWYLSYKVINEMNSELQRQVYCTIASRVSKKYFFVKVNHQPQAGGSCKNSGILKTARKKGVQFADLQIGRAKG